MSKTKLLRLFIKRGMNFVEQKSTLKNWRTGPIPVIQVVQSLINYGHVQGMIWPQMGGGQGGGREALCLMWMASFTLRFIQGLSIYPLAFCCFSHHRGWFCLSVCHLDHFCHIRQSWHEDEGRGRGWKTLQPLCYPCNLSGVIWCRSVLGSRYVSSIIYISSERNVSKNNKNKSFPTFLNWFDLAVTLKWPYHDLGITPLWNQTPTDVIMCTWVGFQ